ncbi:D-alanyl-D-alanine carboxypeptidase/D-alanyl-D-alanine endopeptidase [Verticiella alkaliphila]|uniref:D-alanyl-D-alanine carboxypeptidase/D-alanyl-D-alanine endopeptidase n=1 Tax=Verticiella alkaliphila TaxID=2779529 RepID=UPI0035300FEA
MAASFPLARTLRRLGATGFILVLAGCGTPREAMTPTLDTGAPAAQGTVEPQSRLTVTPQMRAPIDYVATPAADRMDMLPAELREAFQRSGLSENAVSVVVAEVGQPPMIAINPGQPRNPASVMKLVTTYAALEGLGPSYTWRTELLAPAGARVGPDGTLSGPLYLRAGGDPDMRLEDLWQLMRELRLRGVRQMPGIVVDRSRFGDVTIDPGAFDNSPDRVYNASPDALMVGFGALRLLYLPDTATGQWNVVLDPPIPGIRVDNQVRATRAACPGAPAVRTDQSSDAQGITLRVTGSVALSCGEFSAYRLALTQPQHTTAVLAQMWRELGGTLTGPVVSGQTPAGATVLAARESRPLSEQIRTVNKQSNNVMARMMLLTLGAELGDGPATTFTGQRALANVLASQGLRFPELVVDNGSGLSRDGRISAASLAAMLESAWESPRMPEFLSSMAVAGEDGTVRRRWRDGNTAGRAHLKTGTLRDVSALAGYVLGASGRRYLVAIMANDPKASGIRAFNDRLIAWLAGR